MNANIWWIDEQRILGSSNPTTHDLEALRFKGFSAIISLLHENGERVDEEPNYDVELIRNSGYKRYSIPIRDGSAPTRNDFIEFQAILEHSLERGKVIVHCEGGQGRTGTMGAAYWIGRGLDAGEAVKKVRRHNPRAVESPLQHDFISSLEENLPLNYEALRMAWRPKDDSGASVIRMLWIAESPPTSGEFFYETGKQKSVGLFAATRKAFIKAGMCDAKIENGISDVFLDEFSRSGSYLVDLCPYPIDKLKGEDRHAARREHTKWLSEQIEDLKVERGQTRVICLMKSIEEFALEAVGCSKLGWRQLDLVAHFPGKYQQGTYVDEITQFLSGLKRL
jgi:atypical dual specificity phosphatase